jgi:hypothetical protein
MKPPHYSGTFDEYAKQLLRQNQNLPCAHCGSSLGHYATCPLISRDAAELASTQPIAERTIAVPEFSTEDTLRLRAWGVKP